MGLFDWFSPSVQPHTIIPFKQLVRWSKWLDIDTAQRNASQIESQISPWQILNGPRFPVAINHFKGFFPASSPLHTSKNTISSNSHICSFSTLSFFLPLSVSLSQSLHFSPFLLLLHPSLSLITLASDLHSIFVTQESLYIFDLVIISQYILFQFNVLCPAHPWVHRIGNWQPGKLNKKTTRLAEPQLCCRPAHTNPI